MKHLIKMVRGLDSFIYNSRDFILAGLPWFCVGLMVFVVIFHVSVYLINTFL
jgi:hypothetical protein